MGASASAEPELLDALVRAEAAWGDPQRRAIHALQRALEELGPSRRELAPVVGAVLRDLRRLLAHAEQLAGDVAATAAAFRAADRLLDHLGAAASIAGPATAPITGTAASPIASAVPAPIVGSAARPNERGTVLPVPDVSIEWRWPEGWTHSTRWGDARLGGDGEVGAGVRSAAGAGVDVTRDAIRSGAFEELRIGAWAAAAVGSAIGPFAARASGEVFVGARGGAEALVHVGRDGARARLGGDAFAGVRADGEVRGSVGPVQAGAEGAVSYGVGVTGQADIDLTPHRIGGRVKLGAALGLGLDVGFEYYLEPAWLADGLVDLAGGAVEVGTTVAAVGSDVLSGAASTVGEALGAGGSVLRTVGGWLG
jgi:hypothetical protein